MASFSSNQNSSFSDISDEFRTTFNFGINIFIAPFLAFGILSNAVNMAVFIKMGIRDGVMVTFLGLSISDVCQLCVYLFTWSMIMVTETKAPKNPGVDYDALVFLSIWYNFVFCDIAVVLTTYLALQRCCCVAMPLQFKNKFTFTRSLFVVGSTFTFVPLTYVSILTSQGLTVYRTGNDTSPGLRLWLGPGRVKVIEVYDITNKIIMKTAGQVIVVLSLLVISARLAASLKFRLQSAAAASVSSSSCPLYRTRLGGTEDSTRSVRQTRYDLQVVKAVALVSVVFVMSNTPRLIFTYGRRIEPELNLYGRYNNLYLASSVFCNVVECLNASCNIFIYYRYNSKFAAILRSLLSCFPMRTVHSTV